MTDRPSRADGPMEAGVAVRRNAVRGFAAGAAIAVAVFTVFALLPGTARPLGLYVGLAGVLGVTVGVAVTVALVAWQAHRLTRGL